MSPLYHSWYPHSSYTIMPPWSLRMVLLPVVLEFLMYTQHFLQLVFQKLRIQSFQFLLHKLQSSPPQHLQNKSRTFFFINTYQTLLCSVSYFAFQGSCFLSLHKLRLLKYFLKNMMPAHLSVKCQYHCLTTSTIFVTWLMSTFPSKLVSETLLTGDFLKSPS